MSLDTDTPLLIQQDLYFGSKIPYGKAAAVESLK